MSHVSHRLKGAIEGALAGGGDPATSPLYVFGPYLQLLGASACGALCFGAPIWMVVATVVVVSLMYRHVMEWVPDGSGGSGLCEEEFGGWAVKINASITAIEYTLTFLVSVAALVTFIADRFAGLGRWERTAMAVALTVFVGFIVNRGPRIAARVFGPATAAVLVLLWVLVFAVIAQRGLHVPPFSWEAFHGENLQTTFGGYVRLLALMTGIEVFANLVAAYDGSAQVRARKAFGSLLIVMITTLTTMVIVGPAIEGLSDASRTDVSVFTQTMDQLLPRPLAWAGTLVGIIVLSSAAAASAQGLQNLALGLRHRHYVPASFGQRNRFDVADRPVWMQVGLVAVCFVAFGTHEETYLTLYAAGVFVLLGLTGWASVKRLRRELKLHPRSLTSFLGTALAALVTTAAAGLIFYERFTEGAWAYFILVPLLYVGFTQFRKRLGSPMLVDEQLGRSLAEHKSFTPVLAPAWPGKTLALVDGSPDGDALLLAAAAMNTSLASELLVGVVSERRPDSYLAGLQRALQLTTTPLVGTDVQDVIGRATGARLIIAARELVNALHLAQSTTLPVLSLPELKNEQRRFPSLGTVVVGLDGSAESEAVLPIVARLMSLGATVRLALVPDGASEALLQAWGERTAASLRGYGPVALDVGGSGPARTLIELAKTHHADLVVVASHGAGGGERAPRIPLGSVPERLLSDLECALLIVPGGTARPSAAPTAPARQVE